MFVDHARGRRRSRSRSRTVPRSRATSLGDGRVRVQFGDTIQMSTYLVALVVGQLELTDPVDVGGIPVRVAHVPGRGAPHRVRTRGRRVRAAVLHRLLRHPVSRREARPRRAPRLLVRRDGEPRLRDVPRDRVCSSIPTHVDAGGSRAGRAHDRARDRAHVVRRPRDDEVVERHLAERSVRDLHGARSASTRYQPEWRTWDDFALGRAAALDIDALSNTRTVEYEVRTPEDADGMFDVLTYQKGGSVVRMLEQWLGADAFRAGVRHYLDRTSSRTPRRPTCGTRSSTATGRPARRIMDSWIFQPGFPRSRPNRSTDGVRVTQRRFRYDRRRRDRAVVDPGARRGTPGAMRRRTAVLLDDDATTIPTATGEPVVLNAGGEGFYRVAYPPAWPARLARSGRARPRASASSLVDDAWAAVLVGTMPAARVPRLRRRRCATRPTWSCGACSWRGSAASRASSKGAALDASATGSAN